jgi:2'-5' RNA ligase
MEKKSETMERSAEKRDKAINSAEGKEVALESAPARFFRRKTKIVLSEEDEVIEEEAAEEQIGRGEKKRYWKQKKLVTKRKQVVEVSEEEVVEEAKRGPKRKHRVAPKGPRPNFFLSVRITNPDILNTVDKVQEGICSHFAKLQKCTINPRKLHITLFVMYLEDPEQLRLARAALEDSVAILEEYFPAGCPEFKFKNLNAFGTRVLYMEMEPGEQKQRLCQFVAALKKLFQARGLLREDEREEFTPHATIMKTSQVQGRMAIKQRDYREYLTQDFGADTFSCVELNSMQGVAEDGFYPTWARVYFAPDSSPRIETEDHTAKVFPKKERERVPWKVPDEYSSVLYYAALRGALPVPEKPLQPLSGKERRREKDMKRREAMEERRRGGKEKAEGKQGEEGGEPMDLMAEEAMAEVRSSQESQTRERLRREAEQAGGDKSKISYD